MTFDVRLRAYSPGTDTKLGFLTDPLSFQASFVHNNDGALTVKYSELGEDGNLAARTVDQGLDVALEYSNGGAWAEPDNGRFLMVGKDYDRHDPAKVHNISLVSWSWLMTKICDLNLTKLEGSKSKNAGKRKFASKDAGDIVKTLLDEHDARSGPAVPIVRDSWSASVDSAGVAWAKKRTRYYEPGQPLHDRLDALVQDGLCDWRTRGRGLRMYNQNSACIDRSATVKLTYGDDLNDAPSTLSQADRVARLLVKGDGKHRVTVTDPAVPELYGRWEAMMDASGVDSNAELDEAGDSELATRNRVKGEYTRDLTLSGTFLPFVDYNVGDWITAPGAAGSERLRVMQITITRDEQNGLSGNIVLGDRFTSADLKMAGKLAAITAGTSAVGGSGTTVSVQVDTRQPAAPTNLSAAAELYTEPRRWRARVTLAWDAVAQATDGTALDIDLYTILGQRAGGEWQVLTSVSGSTTTAIIDGLTPGEEWVFSVAAVGVTTTETGAQSAPVAIVLPVDTDPPAKPSPAELSSSASILTVGWDGLAVGGQPMDADLDYVQIYAGTTNPPTQVIGRMSGRGAWSGYTNAGEVVYVCLEAVDWAGNTGPFSDITEITISSVLDDPGLQAVLATTARIYMQDDEPGVDVPAGSWWFTRTRTEQRPLKLSYTEHGTVDGSTVWEARTLDASAVIAAGTVVSSVIGAEAIRAYHIAAGEVTADKIGAGLLSAQITLSGVIRTADAGARVVMDSGGVTLFDADGTPITSINTDGTSSFYGKATLTELEVAGTMALTMPGNSMEPGSTLVLEAGLQAPTASPNVSSVWPSIPLRDSAGQQFNLWGYEFVGYMSSGNMVFWRYYSRVSIFDPTGAWIRDVEGVGNAVASAAGAVIVSDRLVFVEPIEETNPIEYQLVAADLTTGAHSRYYSFGSHWQISSFIDINVAWDSGTRLIIQDANRLIIHSFTWSGDKFSTTTTTKTVNFGGRRLLARSSLDLGIDCLFATAGSIVNCYTYSTGAPYPNGDFYTPVEPAAMGYYGGHVWVSDESVVYTLDGPTWNDSGTTKPVTVGRTYRHPGNGFESKLSPVTVFNHKKRARLKFSSPGWMPTDEVTHLRYYASFAGNLYSQGDSESGVLTRSSLLTSGSTPPTSSSFPGSTPAEIRSENGAIVLRADGTGAIPAGILTGAPATTHAKLVRTADLPTSGSSWKTLPFTSVELASGALAATTTQITVTNAGVYMAAMSVVWSNTAHRRLAEVRINGSPVVGAIRVELNASGYMSGGASGLVHLAAGDEVSVAYYAAGGTLQAASMSLLRVA